MSDPADLDSLVARASEVHPEFGAEDAFRAHLAGLPPPISVAHPADLYLAWACLQTVPAALATFELQARPAIRRAVRRICATREDVDDLTQQIFEGLLLDNATAGPRLLKYSGRGPLLGWCGVVATRAALQMLRRTGREIAVDGQRIDQLRLPSGDLELAYMKSRYRAAFGDAFGAALASLSERHRLVLRYHVIDGLSIDDIARLHGVHRATAARWINRARQLLLERTRARLMRTEGLSDSEYESVTRLIRSQLDLSLHRRLGDTE